MSTTLKINGNAVNFVKGTLIINLTLGALSVLTFDIDSLDRSTRYDLDDDVTVEDGATLIFGGVIKDILESGLSEELSSIRSSIMAMDYNCLPDRCLVTGVFEAQSLKSRLQGLMTFISALGVTLHGSQVTGPDVSAVVTEGRRFTDVLNDLSIESGYIWEIDSSKVLRMYLPGTVAASFNITVAAANYLRDLTVQRTRQDYANRITLYAGGDGQALIPALSDQSKYVGPGTTSGSFRYWDIYPPGLAVQYPFNGGIFVSRSGALTGGSIGRYRIDNTDYQYSHGRQEPFGRAVLALSPTDYWKLLEISGVTSAADEGSGAHNGTYISYQPASYINALKTGWYGYKFNDVGNITLPSVAASTTTFTVSFWFQPDASQVTDHGGIFRQLGVKGVGWRRSTGKLFWYQAGFQYSTRALQHGITYFVVISCTGGTATVYINGVADATQWTGLTSFTPDRIGVDNALRGMLSDVAYWSGTALTQSQISALWNEGNGIFEMRIYQKTSVTVLGSSDWISVDYNGQFPIKLTAENAGEISANGVWQKSVFVSEIASYSAALQRLTGELAKAINNPAIVRYPTRTTGLLPGRLQNVNVSERNINADCTISSILIREDDDGVLKYQVTDTQGTIMPALWQNTIREWGGQA